MERWGRRYLFYLRGLSQWLTRLIGDGYRFRNARPKPFWPYLKANWPTVESYEFCLILLAYVSGAAVAAPGAGRGWEVGAADPDIGMAGRVT
ncbi:MAG: hypothetical protein R3E95_04945 [Thiolinea sp.]